eukprot:7024929-Prorocentrum_lima.AAC.1
MLTGRANKEKASRMAWQEEAACCNKPAEEALEAIQTNIIHIFTVRRKGCKLRLPSREEGDGS